MATIGKYSAIIECVKTGSLMLGGVAAGFSTVADGITIRNDLRKPKEPEISD